GVFEDCPDQVRKPISSALPAIWAFPFVLHGGELVDALAFAPWAADANGPTVGDQVAVASGFVWESSFPLLDGHLVDLLRLLSAGHVGSPYRQVRDYRGISYPSTAGSSPSKERKR